MKELGITKGEWKVDDDVFSINCPNEVKIDVMGRLEIYREKDMICEIIVDAGNTAQKCGLLPSELLRQRDELKEALISMMWQFAYYGTKNNVAVMHTGGLSALEDAFSALGLSDPITVENFEAAIKNTER